MTRVQSLSLQFSEEELSYLDQSLLPQEEIWSKIKNVEEAIDAIQKLRIRGAPLIGVAASFALAQSALKGHSTDQLLREAQQLYGARPTAVNLMNCMDRMKKVLSTTDYSREDLLSMALSIYQEDVQLCEKIANHGASLIASGDSILTHCNTGALATAGVGTALGIIRRAHEQGKKIHVYVDETRPLLQGGRLTAWELEKLQIPYTLITDSMAGHLMSQGRIQKVFVGADRIAANGDFANKIGTYPVAVLSHFHRIPFYVAAPQTTVDPQCPSGENIPIEERNPQEVRGAAGSFGNITWAPKHSNVYNPSFDVTPSPLIAAWILDTGIFNHTDVFGGCFENLQKNTN